MNRLPSWAGAVIGLVVAVPIAAGAYVGFPDVPRNHPQHADIQYAVEQGWFEGYPDGTFKPDRELTTDQAVTVFRRSFPDGITRADLATMLRAGEQALDATPEPYPPPPVTLYTHRLTDLYTDPPVLGLPSSFMSSHTYDNLHYDFRYNPHTGYRPLYHYVCYTKSDGRVACTEQKPLHNKNSFYYYGDWLITSISWQNLTAETEGHTKGTLYLIYGKRRLTKDLTYGVVATQFDLIQIADYENDPKNHEYEPTLCETFDSQSEAQAWFEWQYSDSGNTEMDPDGDGRACEDLP